MSAELAQTYPGQGAGYPTWSQMQSTGRYLTRIQCPDGSIPWEPGRHTDVWDHVECAMALSATGQDAEAEAAFDWMVRAQRPDGTWPIEVVGEEVTDAGFDTNHCAYVAVGVWHRWLVTGDAPFVQRLWPVVAAALDAVIAQQLPGGGISWAVGRSGVAMPTGLLAGSASIAQSLRCGARLADLLGEDGARWEAARERVVAAVRSGEGLEDKARYSMDWYYPVLAGAIRGEDARERLRQRWPDFVVDGLGAHCVSDRPWVTGAETCELAMALEAIGEVESARELVAAMQHLREDDGSYHTGLVYTDGVRWPVERSTWTAASVVLAVDAIDRVTPGSGIFRDAG